MTSAPTLGQAIDQIINALTPLDENARQTALYAVCMQLGLSVANAAPLAVAAAATPPPRSLGDAGTSHEVQTPLPAPRPHRIVDIRSFKEEKKPTSARQMACVVAFYLQELAPEADRKDTVTAPDLEKYFKQGGFKLPTKIPQVLIDSKLAGYFDPVGRGEYKLNAVGYNLVSHGMPGKGE